MSNTPTLQRNSCEECGLPQEHWKGNHGRGIRESKGHACCIGCAEGLVCNCRETGVRRVVIVKSEENKKTYVKKMGRQMKDWQTKISDIEKTRRRAAPTRTRR